jgi:hypothetical protein
MNKKMYISMLVFSTLFANDNTNMVQKQLEELKIKVAYLEHNAKQSANKSASFSQNAYLPDIAFILNMSAVSRNVKNSDYEKSEIEGFIKPSTMNFPFNKNRGFNFNYVAFAMHSVVDPYFEAFANFHLQPDAFHIGEAFVQTTSLPYSLKIKAGKFKSSFGRVNKKHQHSWRFDSQPIVYKAFFGPAGISDAGIEVEWIAPTDTYLMFGAEAMQGTNGRSFGDTESNNLYVGYVKSSIDIADTISMLGGVSLAHGKNSTKNATDVYGVDFTLRDQLGSYSAIIWQSEYLKRIKDLGASQNKQSGFYSELIYEYNKNYSTGVRYDKLLHSDNLDRYTAMIEYKPFPMSRLRLSYTYDRTKVIDNERKNINEIMLSLNIAAGAHGAHDY